MANLGAVHIDRNEATKLCQELRYITGATDVQPVCDHDDHADGDCLLRATIILAGVHLHYYCVALQEPEKATEWFKFNFEGRLEDLKSRFLMGDGSEESYPRLRKLHNTRRGGENGRDTVLTPDSEQAVGSPLDSKTACNTEDGTSSTSIVSIMATEDDAAAQDFSWLLELPREMRDMIYEHVRPGTFALFRFDMDGQCDPKIWITPSGLGNANQQLRLEYVDSLRGAQDIHPAMALLRLEALPSRGISLAGCPQNTHLCIETLFVPDLEELRVIFAFLQVANPSIDDWMITIVIPGESHDDFSRRCERSIASQFRHPRERLRVIRKQYLMVEDGTVSDFVLYSRSKDWLSEAPAGHCLRSNDLLNLLSLLEDFERPTSGEHALRSLCWDRIEVSSISRWEEEALELALPATGSNPSGLWILKDG